MRKLTSRESRSARSESRRDNKAQQEVKEAEPEHHKLRIACGEARKARAKTSGRKHRALMKGQTWSTKLRNLCSASIPILRETTSGRRRQFYTELGEEPKATLRRDRCSQSTNWRVDRATHAPTVRCPEHLVDKTGPVQNPFCHRVRKVNAQCVTEVSPCELCEVSAFASGSMERAQGGKHDELHMFTGGS